MSIQWGIIGCGDVTELKSGPAFNKVPDSRLVAVMRRNAEKAKDYAERHGVPKWYSNAHQLINDPDVNAIYVATPPLQHEEYTIAALKAGKPVYVEKPMAVNTESAMRMLHAVKENNKVCVAHYRRAQPLFIKLKELLEDKTIGDIKFIDLTYLQPSLKELDLENTRIKWRVDPAVAGGGLFHDLAPHQIDLMLYFFGKINSASGVSANQAHIYGADDIVSGNMIFENDIVFQGLWCFSVPPEETKDICVITGSEGKITFSVFGEPEIILTRKGKTSIIYFQKLQHVQQPMIGKVVQYFLGKGENPSSAENGVEVMRIMEVFTAGSRR
jgi:predicted dehydrogenase